MLILLACVLAGGPANLSNSTPGRENPTLPPVDIGFQSNCTTVVVDLTVGYGFQHSKGSLVHVEIPLALGHVG